MGTQEVAITDTAADIAAQAYIDTTFYSDKDVTHTFHTAAGELIECIDFYAQPSVRGFAAAGIVVDYTNVPAPTKVDDEIPPPAKHDGASLAFDGRLDDDGNARKCPQGSVAMMRPTPADIAAAGGLAAFKAMKRPLPTVDPKQDAIQHDCYHQTTPGQGWDHAAGSQSSVTYYGGLTYTPIYAPFVQNLVTEHSLSQMWVQTNACEDWSFPYGDPDTCTTDAVQSIEVGWVVGNNYTQAPAAPHLFAFTTLDGYDLKNCYAGLANPSSCCPFGSSPTGTDCWIAAPGAPYVVNQSLGAYVQPIGSPPDELEIQITNETVGGVKGWYVFIDAQLIGWYPSTAFTGSMQSSATYLQVGGEVFDSWPNNAHTNTLMGSGIFPSGVPPYYGWKYSAYHRDVQYLDSSSVYHNATLSYTLGPPPQEGDNGFPGVCGYNAGVFGYSLSTTAAPGQNQQGPWNTFFYFGGNIIE